jgi:hypothetical protein
MLKSLRIARLDRVETVYLAMLRIGALAVATLCLLTAGFFAVDGLWRIAVPDHVDTKPTVVAPAEVASAMRVPPPSASTDGDDGVSSAVKQAHEAFASKVFPAYYAVYRRAMESARKPDDKILTQAELMSALGYGLDIYAAGESLNTKLFVEDAEYQRQAQAAVTAAMADPATANLLKAYKAAEKSEQSCTTTNTRQFVPQVCGYYYAYDCSYTRTVPVRRCEAVYPNGIVSPGAAFERADRAFQRLWLEKSEANARAANEKTGQRLATRAQIGPRLMLALSIMGAFLIVMFFFLIVAIERHLRRMSAAEEGS